MLFLIDMHIILRLDKWNDILYNNKKEGVAMITVKYSAKCIQKIAFVLQ